jgi:hypothetical protein
MSKMRSGTEGRLCVPVRLKNLGNDWKVSCIREPNDGQSVTSLDSVPESGYYKSYHAEGPGGGRT